MNSDYFKKWNPNVDYRQNPHLYKIGRGQQGVLICEPYKSEICAHWRFKTPLEALVSSQKILKMFTRARRYANHRDGKKYNPDGSIIPQEPDALTCDKATSARIFYERWKEARENKKYLTLKKQHKKMYG